MLTHDSLFYTGLEFKDLPNHYRYQHILLAVSETSAV